MSLPGLSIVVPTYNRSRTLANTLDSLLGQTLLPDNLEIIVSNDNSSDDTCQVLESYRSRLPQMRVFHQDRNLREGNWAFVLEKATREFVFVLCDDDAVPPDFLESYLPLAQAHPDLDMILGDIDLRGPSFEPLHQLQTQTPGGFLDGRARCMHQLRSHHMVMTTMYRRSLLLDAGGWDRRVGTHFDCTAFCRSALRARRTYRFERPMLRFRVSVGSWSHTLAANQRQLAQWYHKKFELLDDDAAKLDPEMLPFLKQMRAVHARSVLSYLEIELGNRRLDGPSVRRSMSGLFESFPEGRNNAMSWKLSISTYLGTGWLTMLRKMLKKPNPYASSLALFNAFDNTPLSNVTRVIDKA